MGISNFQMTTKPDSKNIRENRKIFVHNINVDGSLCFQSIAHIVDGKLFACEGFHLSASSQLHSLIFNALYSGSRHDLDKSQDH